MTLQPVNEAENCKKYLCDPPPTHAVTHTQPSRFKDAGVPTLFRWNDLFVIMIA